MADTKWHINGDYYVACNCDYGCPCVFNARPSPGFCEGVLGFRVKDGVYGDVRLEGKKAFVVVKWPAAIHEGHGVASIYIDESASPTQRNALVDIVSGKAGGPFDILASTWERVYGPHFREINIKGSGYDTEVQVEGRFRFTSQTIKNPVSKAEAHPKVVLPEGFLYKEGDMGALGEFWVTDGPELSFAYPGKCLQLAQVNWQGP